MFDGHGPKGTPCSVFARHFLPVYLATAMRHTPKPEVALAAAFVHVNKRMHEAAQVDTNVSGTMLARQTTGASANPCTPSPLTARRGHRAFNLDCETPRGSWGVARR